MTREDMIKELKNGTCYECAYGTDATYNCRAINPRCPFHVAFCEAVDNMERTTWIPVEKELPEECQMVLVTCQPKKQRPNVNRAYYMSGSWHGSGSMSNVTAWMPLPESYKGGDGMSAGIGWAKHPPEYGDEWRAAADIALKKTQGKTKAPRNHFCDLYVIDKTTGEIHRVGEDPHDSLVVYPDGGVRYYNMQNGDGGGPDNDPRSGYCILQTFHGAFSEDVGIWDDRFCEQIKKYIEEHDGKL